MSIVDLEHANRTSDKLVGTLDRLVGTLVGQYRLVSILGAGGMGTVYVGEHTLIGRRAAIKILHVGLSAGRDGVERFFNEARAAAAINHPGIVQIFDFGFAEDGSAYLVMELLEGTSLAGVLHDRGPLPLLDALRTIRQIASAMAAAHAAGILHRDLKPDNIFLVPDTEVAGGRRAKILDFGIAKLATAFDVATTSVGTVMGTPLYMAPEQFRGAPVDERTDIYALGCVLFEALVGEPPFDSINVFALGLLHVSAAPALPSIHRPAVPPALEALVLRCLAKLPDDRFDSMTDLVESLDQVTDAIERTGSPSHAPLQIRSAPPFSSRKTWAGVAVNLHEALASPGAEPPPAEAGAVTPSARGRIDEADDEPFDPTRVLDLAPIEPRPRSASPATESPPSARGAGAARRDRPDAPILPPPATSPSPQRSIERAQPDATIVVAPEPGPSPQPSARDVLRQRLNVHGPGFGAPPQRQEPRPVFGTAYGGAPRETARGTPADALFERHRPPAAMALDSAGAPPDEFAGAVEAAIPGGLRDLAPDAIAFFRELFRTASRLQDRLLELGDPVIRDLASRSHFVLFLDDIDHGSAAPFGQIGTQVFRAEVDPFAARLAALAAPRGSVLITVLAAPQLGQGARETIFALRKERNLFVVPLAAAEIRRACDAGTARQLLINRIADLHTVSDPFAILDGSTDPTRWIGFSAEVADLVKHIDAGGHIVSVAGPPGSGKTSMVAMAEYGCDTSNVARQFVRLRCGELASHDPHRLIHEITARVRRLQGTPPAADHPAPASMRDSILALDAWHSQPGARQFSSRPPRRETGLATRHQLVLVLDDADWLIRLGSAAEPDALRREAARELWRGLAELCASGRHTVIVTSIRDFREMDQVPLERPVSVSRVPMRALTRRESDNLVASLGELVGFRPSRRAFAALHHASGGNVYALRLICSEIIRTTREQPDYSPLASLAVTPRRVAAAALRIAATGSSFRAHVSLWLDEVERVVLQHVARERPRSPRRVRRALEAAATPAQLAKALDGLELMGLVEHHRGHHRVRIPLFERWINIHLDAPEARRNALKQRRLSRITLGFTCTALLFGGYWTWLRTTRSAHPEHRGDCTYQLDYPDRVGSGETIELYVYKGCAAPSQHQLAIARVFSTLSEPQVTSDCAAASASCTMTVKTVAGKQASEIYQVELDVDGTKLMTAAIARDRFATLRSIGEQSVPAISFIPLLFSLIVSFHKDMKKYVTQLLGRGEPAAPEV
jgi:serine/threonine protein kinase